MPGNMARVAGVHALLACAAGPWLACAASIIPTINVNTTKIVSGDSVRVDWAEALSVLRPTLDPKDIPEMRTQWKIDRSDATGGALGLAEHGEGHAEPKCTIVQEANTTSYWVGVFSPAVGASDVTMGADPITPGYPTEGTPPFTQPAPTKFISGSQLASSFYVFQMTNMRATANFVLFEGSLTSPEGFKVLAVSPAITFADANKPMHGRLARTSSTDEMRISWTSSAQCTQCEVQWGDSEGSLDRTTKALPATTYTSSALCGRPANSTGFHDPGLFHSAILNFGEDDKSERQSGKMYWYRFGDPSEGMSEVFSFIAPKPASANAAMSIIVTADMGETYEDGSQYHWEEPAAVNTTVHMKRLMDGLSGGVDIVLHPGDLSYATGYESEWDRFMEQIEPIATSAPYMTGQGNHERDFPQSGNSIGSGDSGGECGVPTQARFIMPTCPEPNTQPCISAPGIYTPRHQFNDRSGPTGPANDGWYSINQGSVHFLMINTEMSSYENSSQWNFIKNDLAAVDRAVTPWVLVFGHRQMYSGNMMSAGNSMEDIEPLLMKYKVDVALWGHIHFAQRSCPMYKAKCINTTDSAGYNAPIHAVIGNAGQGLTAIPPAKDKAAWSVYNAAEWGFSHITVYNATDLKMDFYGDVPLDQTAPVHHTFSIKRGFPRT